MKAVFFTRAIFVLIALAQSAISLADPLNPTLKIGDPAPPIDAMAWLKGEPVKRFEPGHVYVVDFWATWCVPCIESMPHLSELQKKYAGRLTVIGISAREVSSIHSGGKAPDVAFVRKFVEKKAGVMAYTVAMDDPEDQPVFDAWMMAAGAFALPMAFVIDGRGRVVWLGQPNDHSQHDFDIAVERALSGKSDLQAARAIQKKVNEETNRIFSAGFNLR